MGLPIINKINHPASRTPAIFTPNSIQDLINFNLKPLLESLGIEDDEVGDISALYWKTTGTTLLVSNVVINNTSTQTLDFNVDVDIEDLTINGNYHMSQDSPGSDNQDRLLVGDSNSGGITGTTWVLPSVLLAGTFWEATGATTFVASPTLNFDANTADAGSSPRDGYRVIFQGGDGLTGTATQKAESNSGLQFDDNSKLFFQDVNGATYDTAITINNNTTLVGDSFLLLPPSADFSVSGAYVSGRLEAIIATQKHIADFSYLDQATADGLYAPLGGSVSYWRTSNAAGNTLLTTDVTIAGAAGTEEVTFGSNLATNIVNLDINNEYQFPTTAPNDNQERILVWPSDTSAASNVESKQLASEFLDGKLWQAMGDATLLVDSNITGT